jgi:hypothetical protein
LTFYERYISKGVCQCGAERFFSDALCEGINHDERYERTIARVNELNRTLGKEGNQEMGTYNTDAKQQITDSTPVDNTLSQNISKLDIKAVRKFYRHNKKQLITDLVELGNKAFLAKYAAQGLRPRHISNLKKDPLWAGTEKSQQGQTNPAEQPKPDVNYASKYATSKLNNGLPAFNSNWTEAVMIKWLDTY